MRTEPRPPRSGLAWVLGFVALGVIVGVVVALFWNRQPAGDPGAATASPPAATSTPTETETAVPDTAPAGCLGGTGRDAQMVLDAMNEAPHTTNGAVEFASTFARWLHQYPNPSADDANAVRAAAFSKNNADFDVAAYFDTKPNLSGGLIPDGQEFTSSTLQGVWYVEAVEPDAVTVSVGVSLVVDGAVSPDLRGAITVSVVWEGDSWKFDDSEGTRTPKGLFGIGTAFTAGC